MALRNVPLVTNYLQLLGMDRGYDFPLTLGLPEEGAYQLQLTTHDTKIDSVLLRLPDTPIKPRLRRQRYEKLAMGIAYMATLYEGDPHHQTLLAAGVGKRLLSELNQTAGTFELRVQRQSPQQLESILLGLAREEPSTVIGMSLMVSPAGKFQVALQEKENLTATVRQEGQHGEIGGGSHSKKAVEPHPTKPPSTKSPITKQ
jgi:hypothetical protein